MVEKANITAAETALTLEPPEQTEWHLLFGGIQEPLLVPVEIAVETEPLASQKPPRLDLLLLRRKGNFWTPAQQARLPDGIRLSSASHILCEFKYTQSVNEQTLLQARLYDYLYLSSRRLKRRAVQTFVVSSRTPQPATLTAFGYEPTAYPGVYHSQDRWLNVIDLLVLNELSDEPHNAFFKCFASRKKEREAAFATMERMAIWQWSEELWATVNGLHTVLRRLDGGAMKQTALTPEYLRKLGEGMRDQILASLSPEQRLAGLSPKEILAQVPPEQLLAELAPEQLLAGLAPEQRLAGLDRATIEAYLQQQEAAAAKPTGKAPAPRQKAKKRPATSG
jgi:hypothetical protein